MFVTVMSGNPRNEIRIHQREGWWGEVLTIEQAQHLLSEEFRTKLSGAIELAIHGTGRTCPECGRHVVMIGEYCDEECAENAREFGK